VTELGEGPFAILNDRALYAITQMIRRAMEVGYWHGRASAEAGRKADQKAKKRLADEKQRNIHEPEEAVG